MDDFVKILLNQGPFVAALSFILFALIRGTFVLKREMERLEAQITKLEIDRDKWRGVAEAGSSQVDRSTSAAENAVQQVANALLQQQKDSAAALKAIQEETAADLIRRADLLQRREDALSPSGGVKEAATHLKDQQAQAADTLKGQEKETAADLLRRAADKQREEDEEARKKG